MIDITTVGIEQTTNDALKRKKKEFGDGRANDTIIELIRLHDVLPDWIGHGPEARRFLKELDDYFPDEVDSIEDARVFLES